jgi:hypothetical protein
MVPRMLRPTLILATSLFAACGKTEPVSDPPDPVAPAAPVKVVEPAAAVVPAAPAYSAAAASKLAGELEKCKYDFNCDAYKPMVAFGAKATPDLLKIVTDATKPATGRAVAAQALGEIRDPAAGAPLLEAAKAEQDFMLRGALFEAAGKTGADEVLSSAGALLLTDTGWKIRIELNKAIIPFGRKAFAWAVAALPAHKSDKFAVSLADVIVATAQAGDESTLKELTATARDEMAKDRLASKSVELGDTAQVAVLITNLEKGDEYTRADAGNMLARVAERIPADQKAKVLELVKAARARDKGGLTSAGFDKVITQLGG